MPRKSAQELFSQATDIEKAVYIWLLNHGVSFEFQSQLIGGYDRQLGDAVADFYLIDYNFVFRVQSEYWHTGAEVESKDIFQRTSLEGLGYTVVDLYEEDIKTRLDETMRMALNGEEQPQ